LFSYSSPFVQEFDLGERLVGERSRHDEAWVAGGVAEVHEAAFGQEDHALAIREFDHVDLRLDVRPLEVLQAGNLNLVVEVTDVADDGHVLQRAHVIDRDDVLVAGGGDDDVGAVGAASSSVTTSNPSIAACSAQIGSTSVTLRRGRRRRPATAAEPLPTSP
jgi:hypothetical protein